ncbi:MAG: hypothetical protein HOC20_04855 [Chloroflexi bacterium]|jgi:metal-responsive CopG/Arc/MetJ family transcriptional regulator|nr:hypothetical protein [Chloroflexota bacterium]
MTTQMEKISISLPKELVAVADEVAKEEYDNNRSKLFAAHLRQLARERLQAEMEEGYMVMAEEHRKFAELSSDIAHEVIPEWQE